MATIRIDRSITATIEKGRWRSSDPGLANLLNSILEGSGCDPDADHATALRVVEWFGPGLAEMLPAPREETGRERLRTLHEQQQRGFALPPLPEDPDWVEKAIAEDEPLRAAQPDVEPDLG